MSKLASLKKKSRANLEKLQEKLGDKISPKLDRLSPELKDTLKGLFKR